MLQNQYSTLWFGTESSVQDQAQDLTAEGQLQDNLYIPSMGDVTERQCLSPPATYSVSYYTLQKQTFLDKITYEHLNNFHEHNNMWNESI